MTRRRPSPSNKQKSPSGFIRIIGGQWRGRKLPVHDKEGLRPTTDRVKETLFNWLMNDVRDAHCLDCFAGSGGLGFEALSRWAATTTLIEKASQVAAQLKQNIQLLSADNGDVIQKDALSYLENNTSNQQFDIVFIDPPFRMNLAQPCIDLLDANHWLSKNALIYIETEQDSEINIPSTWECLKEKTAGQVAYRLYQKNTS